MNCFCSSVIEGTYAWEVLVLWYGSNTRGRYREWKENSVRNIDLVFMQFIEPWYLNRFAR